MQVENIEKRVLDLQRAISLGYVNLQEALGFDYRQAVVPIMKQHIQVRLTGSSSERLSWRTVLVSAAGSGRLRWHSVLGGRILGRLFSLKRTRLGF